MTRARRPPVPRVRFRGHAVAPLPRPPTPPRRTRLPWALAAGGFDDPPGSALACGAVRGVGGRSLIGSTTKRLAGRAQKILETVRYNFCTTLRRRPGTSHETAVVRDALFSSGEEST